MTKNILESFVLIVVAVAFGIIMTWPKYQEFETKSSMVEGKRADLESRLEYYKSLEQTAAGLKNYGPNLAKIESALPDKFDAASLINYLESSSMQAGLVLRAISYSAAAVPSVAETLDQTQVQPSARVLKQFSLTFTLAGTYESWKTFLSSIEKSSRMVEIETLQVTGGGDQSKIGTTVMPTTQQKGNMDYVVKLTANNY